VEARPALATRPPTVRARSTNDWLFIVGLDGRSKEARRVRDIILSLVNELGGPDVASDEEKSLAREAAFTIAASERTKGRILRGEDVDLGEASRLANLAARYRKDIRARRKRKAEPTRPTTPLAAHFARSLRSARV
jgi:hypothetical protein